ncbi:hypothetical protein VP01_10552g1, partial [Puccinia sorghi]
FHYCEPGSELFALEWAVTSGCVIYLDLQEAILNFLKLCNSFPFRNNLTLIHDVCPKYSSKFGCLETQRKRVGMKTNSGSHNNTIARMKHQKIYKIEGSELSWDCDSILSAFVTR